jgi:hypothetical protein
MTVCGPRVKGLTARSSGVPAVILALNLAVLFTGQWARDLVTVDDLRESEVAREMYAA